MATTLSSTIHTSDMTLQRSLYSTLVYSAVPLIFLKLLWRSRKAPAYRQRWAERIASFETPELKDKVIWIHTVSVGEFIAAKTLVSHFAEKDDTSVVVTTTTPTGSEQVKKAFADKVFHVYCPYDAPAFVRRFLNRVKPTCAVLMETELWPNIVHQCSEKGIPVVLANGRMSEKSARAYQKFAGLTAEMLSKLSAAAVQNEDDALRFRELGLSESQLTITGSVKFDLNISEDVREAAQVLKRQLNENGQAPIWIAASTHKGEDEIILNAYTRIKARHPKLKLLLVPRHPERFDSVFQLCRATGFQTLRRSEGSLTDVEILLCDTMGELLTLLGAADYAFIGGSLVNTGGHNYIEPAAWGLPILSGPSTFNFRKIARQLEECGGLQICSGAAAIDAALSAFIESPDTASKSGAAAKALADENRGALERLISLIENTVTPS
jgi:3-deoxy-D-manno-octulosonic-acid transferase